MNKARWVLVAAILSITVVGFSVYRATAGRSTSSSTPSSAAENKNSSSESHAAPPAAASEVSQRGPGMRPQGPDALKFPVPRTLDLTYVTAANFATALGDDPLRIFSYVRDEIAFESYVGCLRGPRGTLLALAGNSVDRASLLASMLQHGGQRVRFAHGTLPEPLARELVSSMWADRPQPPTDTNSSAEAKAAVEKLVNSVQRDYKLIRDQLKKANVTFTAESAPSLDSLITETRDHYWVQWLKDGNWVDLDPSFADSTPGTKYASANETVDTIPDIVYHKVEIRVRIEEYTGNQPSSRVVLTRDAKAADLSGVTLLLAHEPENWNGPADNLQAALASAIQDTGRIKPVLFLGGENWAAGAPFYPKSPPTAGMGGIFNALAGMGTRHDAPLASAETVELDLISPHGQKETVTRDIFDLVGPARRLSGIHLTADAVSNKSNSSDSDVTQSVYDFFLTTGRIDTSLLPKTTVVQDAEDASDVAAALRRINLSFAALSDSVPSITPVGARVVFYPDSPRVQVAELSSVKGKVRLVLDLRRDHVCAVVAGAHPEDVFLGRIFHGVTDGELERFLLDYLFNSSPKVLAEDSRLSTSLIFDRAAAEAVPIRLLSHEDSTFMSGLPEDTRARLAQDFSQGLFVIAPAHTIELAGRPRLAWWRLYPSSGDVTPVTDEGLNQGAIEYKAVVNHNVDRTISSVKLYSTWAGSNGPALFTGLTQSQFLQLIRDLLALGAIISHRNLY